MNNIFIILDIGGTWIKGVPVPSEIYSTFLMDPDKSRLFDFFQRHLATEPSPLHEHATLDQLLTAFNRLIQKMDIETGHVEGIGISTAGVVNYKGTRVDITSPHLALLKNDGWIKELEARYGCTVSIINDADAVCVALCDTGVIKGNKMIGVLVTGTGAGFSVWNNGRRWRPRRVLPLLGSVTTPAGTFDNIVSITKLVSLVPSGTLQEIFSPACERERQAYLKNLGDVIKTAAILYDLDELYVSGGLVEAARASGFDLEISLKRHIADIPELGHSLMVHLAEGGNFLQLTGALSLIAGESTARSHTVVPQNEIMQTEIPYDNSVNLQSQTAINIVSMLWKAEQEAGCALESNLLQLAAISDKVADRISRGGRLIYVGAGSSGRIAAVDAVEIPCTYGISADRVIAIIAGGSADAAMDIEGNFEEDASGVAEMLLLNISSKDLVIGISASGSSYFVQSALAFSKNRGAYSILIQHQAPENALPFCDEVFPLHSGREVVAGSTRMKAGTSTKKALNMITTCAMILLGKVYGSYMVDVACVNQKLVNRAIGILTHLFDISREDAKTLLVEKEMSLHDSINMLRQKGSSDKNLQTFDAAPLD
jgi:N-acetylmuramic acid 6-phosphate etherase